jgi:hypothetical protein
MATVKLDLHNKSIADKVQKGRLVLAKLGPTPPTAYAALATALKTATDALEKSSNDYDATEQHLNTLLGGRDTAEAAFDKAFSQLGGQVQTTTGGDAAGIEATGFDTRSAANPVTELTAVGSFNVTTSNTSGEFDFTWDKLPGATIYELRWRKAGDPAGQYLGTKSTTKTRLRLGGFASGVQYEFDLRAHGPREMESPWCNVFRKTAS